MFYARVIGNIVSTIKYKGLDGKKLQILQPVNLSTGKDTGKALVAVDTTDAGVGDFVGYEDGLNFWGGATVFDPGGERLAHGPYFEEALTMTTIDLNQIRRTRARLPLMRDERADLVQKELNRILSK